MLLFFPLLEENGVVRSDIAYRASGYVADGMFLHLLHPIPILIDHYDALAVVWIGTLIDRNVPSKAIRVIAKPGSYHIPV